MAHSNRMSRPIVLDHPSMIHGKVSSLLLKIRDRIAARGHDFTEKPVCLADRPVWVIHKPCLHRSPLFEVPFPVSGTQRMNVIFPDPLLDFLQLRFATSASSFADGAFVFGSETLAKFPGPL